MLVVFMGLFNLRRGMLLVFICGLFKDITSQGTFGLNIFCFSLWFIAISQLSRHIYKDSKFIYMLLIIIATLGNYAIYLLINSLFVMGNLADTKFLLITILVETGYNALFSYFIFDVFKKIVKTSRICF